MSASVKVVVALSGGVDSSVAAALLKEQGYEVIGIMLRLWNEPGKELENRCCTPDSMAIARRVAARLYIPFFVLDAKDIFYNTVVQYFINGYAQYQTPNPCLVCNQRIRWDFLLHHALSLDARFLATGHYARMRRDELGKIQLLRSLDLLKDQSYVLSRLNQFQLDHSLFPIGHLSKPEVRALAKQFNLPASDRPESQDLCFLGNSDYREFLRRLHPSVVNPGPIISKQGEQLGTHHGLAFYTIGQRKGLNISSPYPLYVMEKDSLRNTLLVGQADDLGKQEPTITDVNWISGLAPELPLRAQVKIRYKARPEWAVINHSTDEKISIYFDQPLRDITPGQAAVIYQDDICLGGGIIC
jgi:tRNA-specific 2-thiouridylase